MQKPLLISLSFLVALLLTILPLPQSWVWYRPAWVLLVLLYWLIDSPDRVGIVSAFFVGLLLDVLVSPLLGLNALLYTCLAFLMLRWHLLIRGLSAGQKWLLVLLVETVMLIIHDQVARHYHLGTGHWVYWMPIITTAVCWVWVSWLLRRLIYSQRQRY